MTLFSEKNLNYSGIATKTEYDTGSFRMTDFNVHYNNCKCCRTSWSHRNQVFCYWLPPPHVPLLPTNKKLWGVQEAYACSSLWEENEIIYTNDIENDVHCRSLINCDRQWAQLSKISREIIIMLPQFYNSNLDLTVFPFAYAFSVKLNFGPKFSVKFSRRFSVFRLTWARVSDFRSD